jgi:hypothetical protein
MRQYARPPEGHDYDSTDHKSALKILAAIVLFSAGIMAGMAIAAYLV